MSYNVLGMLFRSELDGNKNNDYIFNYLQLLPCMKFMEDISLLKSANFKMAHLIYNRKSGKD